MQSTTHDAIEDARTALVLYNKLVQEAGVYWRSWQRCAAEWGHQRGRAPVILDKDGRPISVVPAA